MSAAIAVQVEVNGQMVAADDASWYSVAPCGCTEGVTVVQMPYSGELRLDGEAAFGDMLSAAERAQQRERGFTYELGLRSDCVERLSGKCPHVPKWGIQPRPTPDGYLWAASRQSRVLHLVAEDNVRTKDNDGIDVSDVEARCGATSYSWSNLWYRVDGKVECKRCTKAATA